MRLIKRIILIASLFLCSALFLTIFAGWCAQWMDERGRLAEPAEEYKQYFEMVGYYKTKLVNKSYLRAFSVYTSTSNREYMKSYAESLPWSKNGTTYVLFFNDRSNTPDITFIGMEYPHHYDKYLIAQYSKYPTGVVDFSVFKK